MIRCIEGYVMLYRSSRRGFLCSQFMAFVFHFMDECIKKNNNSTTTLASYDEMDYHEIAIQHLPDKRTCALIAQGDYLR